MYDDHMAIIIEAPMPDVRLTATIQRQLRVVFFGTPLFAVPSLRLLHSDGWPIEAVVTAPDKPTGRRMQMTPSPVRTAATELGLAVHAPTSLKDPSFRPLFDAMRPDICVVVAYGKLIPDTLLAVPRLGFVNLHPSLLPAYRGPSPIQSAIKDGCAATGVSIMVLDEQMDHGPVLATEPWTIPSGFDAPLCEDELSRVGARLLAATLPPYAQGAVTPRVQDHTLATFCKKFTRDDGRLDWSQTAVTVSNHVRALAANPGTWTTWNGRTLNILHAHPSDTPVPASTPGTALLRGSELLVACGEGALIIEVLQLEGSTRQDARTFLNGHSDLVSSVLA